MSKVRDENYFQVSGWMVNNLKLRGNELMFFAIIYGFSQEENSRFTGSINYLCDFINCTRTTAINTLKKLESKNYIIKNQKIINGVKFNEYSVNLPLVQNLNMGSAESVHGVVQNLYGGSAESVHGVVQNLYGGSAESVHGVVQNLYGGSAESVPNNKYINNIDNKDKYNTHFEEFWKNYPRKKEKARAYKCYMARLNDGYSEEELLTACKNYARECEKEKTEQRYIKHGSTFLSDSMPFLDYLKMERELSYAEANNIDTLDDIWPD